MAAKKRSKAKAGKRTPTTSSTRAAKPPAKQAKVTRAAASKGKVGGKATAKSAVASASAGAKKAKKKAASKPAASGPAAGKSGAGARPGAGGSASTLGEGDRAPSFDLPDQSGGSVSSESLAGRPYVLYFYPKDDTPGCTTEACAFRDSLPAFDRAGVRVLGVSPDSVASHQKFVGKYDLPFTLLSDSERSLASAYGVWALKKLYGRESMGIVRSTFLIDGDGVIRKVWRGVRVNGHIAEVRAAAEQVS